MPSIPHPFTSRDQKSTSDTARPFPSPGSPRLGASSAAQHGQPVKHNPAESYSAGDSSVSASRPGTSEGLRMTSGGGAPSRKASDEPMLSWDEASQVPSRPTSSQGKAIRRGVLKSNTSSFPTEATKGESSNDPMDNDELDVDRKLDHRKRKRNKVIRSCVQCHSHKRKCDRKRPCGRCIALGLTGNCVYEIDEQRDPNDPEVAESDRLRRRVAELEQVVRDLRQKPSARAPAPSKAASILDHGSDGENRRVIIDRYARFKLDEAQAADNVARLGQSSAPVTVKAERSSQEASGGSADYRAEPYTANLLPGDEIMHDTSGRTVYLGASAGQSMLRSLKELASAKGDSGLLAVPEDGVYSGAFPNLRKTFPFTTIWSHENFCGEIIGLLPNQAQSELLWEDWANTYGSYVSPFHIPSLKQEYSSLFAKLPDEKMSVPLSALAVILTICALGCLSRATAAEMFGHPNRAQRTPDDLGGPDVKEPKDLTTSRLQSELYCGLVSERAADAWAIGGNMIKQATALGLHRDPLSLDPRVSAREAEVKRRVWWSVASLDAMFSIFFGRPSSINFYTTNLPQDRADEELSESPGSARELSTSNDLDSRITDQTFHTAYYQLTIPSFEFLDGIFFVDRQASREALYKWFSPPPDAHMASEESPKPKHTYRDALRLAEDLRRWYSHVPDGLRLDVNDSVEDLHKSRSRKRLGQTLALCIKTWTLTLVIHRPYLRAEADPAAYPESTAYCSEAAHMVLKAYRAMAGADISLVWAVWSMSYRAFQAAAVCAFLALRQPGTELAAKCTEDLRGAKEIFAGRLSTWFSSHPVQSDLCQGIIQLDKLVSLANDQHRRSPAPITSYNGMSPAMFGFFDGPPTNAGIGGSQVEQKAPPTPLTEVRAFQRPASSARPLNAAGAFQTNPAQFPSGNDYGLPRSSQYNGGLYNMDQADSLATSLSGDFNGPSPLALPGFWASMFGIKVDKDGDEAWQSEMVW
ncbi:hypothetical protein L198_05121 [Cryptococcus wingfieldii CBS 7118]|uniref:Zn(2)-C6 fungal-type domain-containing protein n=1 Tax=Cryptococcus wingfieldii CBS 7118 TaxID=1295528 RepID=A0A1E3J0T2_9TREE|nr:hypothetical protein L198_05121 [Cryptococcus wingfieldii CBS 7118]ODN94265.1 hypothetical protein L198_05121 [Cryptococcus wingfieldii CBS 7118]